MAQYIRPKSISQGGRIGILSTARAIEQSEIEIAIKEINKRGYEVELGKSIGARANQFAGTDDLRLYDLQWMLDDPNIEAIVCARGGYGTARLLNKIDWTSFRVNPKWIAGYSDVTAFHSTISNLGIMSLHAIMPVNVKDQTSIHAFELLLDVMSGKDSMEYSFPTHPLNIEKSLNGILTGGNLSMLYSLRGTPNDIDPENKILFMEDLDEYLYHIDRMMQNFELSGFFDKVKGVLVGGMTDMNDNSIPYGKNAEEIVHEHVSRYNIPLYYNVPFGHSSNNLPIICGAEANITSNGNTVSMKINI